MTFMHKKGAFELSITAIVILILGITILGLGLIFITSIFKEGSEQFERAADTVDKQFIEQLKATDETVAIDRPKLEIENTDQAQIFIAFNNKEEADRDYVITSDTACTRIGPDPSCTGVTIEYKTTATNVPAGDVTVQPINLKVDSTAEKGTYIWDLQVNTTSSLVRREIIIDVI